MTTSMRVIIAVIGATVLASPVMAQQSELHPRASSVARAHAADVRARALADREFVYEQQIRSDDCKPYIYAQCGYAH